MVFLFRYKKYKNIDKYFNSIPSTVKQKLISEGVKNVLDLSLFSPKDYILMGIPLAYGRLLTSQLPADFKFSLPRVWRKSSEAGFYKFLKRSDLLDCKTQLKKNGIVTLYDFNSSNADQIGKIGLSTISTKN